MKTQNENMKTQVAQVQKKEETEMENNYLKESYLNFIQSVTEEEKMEILENINLRRKAILEWNGTKQQLGEWTEEFEKESKEKLDHLNNMEQEIKKEKGEVKMKTQETLRILEKYVPKKLHVAIKEIIKDEYGYEVILEPLWLFEKNNTSFFADTLKEMKQDLKKVEHFELENWKSVMKGMGYSLIEIKQLLGETEELEEQQEERTYLEDLMGTYHFNKNDLDDTWEKDKIGYYTENKKTVDWFKQLANAYDILEMYGEEVAYVDYEEVIEWAEELHEEKTLKLELNLNTLVAVYYYTNDTYNLEFDTSLGQVFINNVQASDHPEASTNEEYFEDPDVLSEIIESAELKNIDY